MSKIKFNSRKALKRFTDATASVVAEELQGVDESDLISKIYISSEDKDIQNLTRMYEKQLILCKIDYDRFASGLHDFFTETNNYIKKNNLYNKFFKLVNISYINLNTKEASNGVLNAWHDLLVQQYAYFAGGTKYVVYGVKSNGKIMHTSEIGQYLSEVNYEINMTAKTPHDVMKIFSKYGYKIKNEDEMRRIITNDQMITNMLYQMSYCINEENQDIIQRPFREPTLLLDLFRLKRGVYKSIIIKEILTKRSNLLPQEGINVIIENADSIKEIYMKEEFIDDVMTLLFKIKFSDNTYTFGFYDTYNKISYTMWKESSHDQFVHKPLESLLLQIYLNFTCEMDDRSFLDIEEVNEFDLSNDKVQIKYEFKESNMKSKKGTTKDFDKRNYQQEYRYVKPFLRNLPVGATASEDAIALANKMGILLPTGKTFVRDFRKKIYIK